MKNPALVRYRFDSVEELVSATPEKPICSDNDWFGKVSIPAGWICSDRPEITSVQAAREELSKLSFPVGVKRLNDLAANVHIPALVGVRRRLCRTFEGDDLNIERVWQGELDTAWTRARRLESQGPRRILINLDVCCTAGTPAEALSWRGVAAVALAKALVEAGHVVQLEARSKYELCDYFATQGETQLVAKGATEPFDEHKLASLFCSGLFFRGVEILRCVNNSPRSLARGVAFPREANLSETFEPFDFVLGVKQKDSGDASTAQGWINRSLAQLAL